MEHELDTPEAFLHWASTQRSLEDTVVQAIDLHDHADLVLSCPVAGAVFLGCRMTPAIHDYILDGGGLVFPLLPNLPYEPYRVRLYSPEELMEGYERGRSKGYESTRDARIYTHYREETALSGPRRLIGALARRLHDHAIDDALDDLLHHPQWGPEGARVVAIMGGHGLSRTDDAFRTVVAIGRRLAQSGYLVASGGGPGAMEAAHLGAWLANEPDSAIDEAIRIVSHAPTWREDGWFETAYAVRERFGCGAASLAIPTWFYGHEPTNLFATHIAKYFSNSLREDGLLAIAHHGVIYAPGSAGTVQEIFQDACQNHYGVFGDASPMVFLGRRFWSAERPVLPLLEALAGSKAYRDLICAVDTVDEVVRFIESHPPIPAGVPWSP